jgi:hypothetical protein
MRDGADDPPSPVIGWVGEAVAAAIAGTSSRSLAVEVEHLDATSEVTITLVQIACDPR